MAETDSKAISNPSHCKLPDLSLPPAFGSQSESSTMNFSQLIYVTAALLGMAQAAPVADGLEKRRKPGGGGPLNFSIGWGKRDQTGEERK
ncbi:hypothetical protein CDD83_2181 [Cordyceps sp. RAO-2017]|nr:hypothetical protein CDD83_2181 [Cordyceps sp. RAO-2017]